MLLGHQQWETAVKSDSCRKLRSRVLAAPLLTAGILGVMASSVSAQDRKAYFGQTHVHTSWSLDAYIFGNHLTGPDEAYRYAKGEAIKHPAGYMVKIKRPLDFQGVTDHSEYAGTIKLANDPTSALSKQPIAQRLKVRTPEDVSNIFKWLAGGLAKGEPVRELLDPAVAGTVWSEMVSIADKHYQPGKFTAFASYEWSAAPGTKNMHRNIFFKDSKKVPTVPFSAIDSVHPEDLWNWMDGQRKAGNELLAISHNANLSGGIMFPLEVDSKGRPIDTAWAQQRINNEPLTEMHQLKGTSETHPELSPNDEFANYEIMRFLIGVDNSTNLAALNGSYIREAYQNGLAMHQTRGYNPYKFGVVGAGDSHNTVTSYSQSNYFGGHAFMDATPQARLAGKVDLGMSILHLSTSGLGGVWAEENTREAIFAAMQRKEVFATSGVRIKVRLFGGWDFKDDALKQKDWQVAAYKGGVPMGGDLPAPKGKAPSFIVQAVKDPDDANLDRIQIIKGWTRGGQIFEKIYDVAWSGNRLLDRGGPVRDALVRRGELKLPAVGNTVDVKSASYTNTIGAVELKTVWTDPDFDPSLHAFYYARVLQIPTPRWSTYDAKKLGVTPPPEVPATVQERAWSSPIWYTPTEPARVAGNSGVTVADLKQKGAVALDDAQLKQLVAGKTLKVRNTVTGQQFEILYSTTGRRLITSVDGKAPKPDEIFAAMHVGELGSPAQYVIRDGKIITTVGATPFEVTVYQTGDKFVAARNSEFGYANYEVEQVKE
jgi:hypothetical protein